MNTNITISLDTRRTKKDGTYPVIMRLGHNKRTIPIPLDICVSEKDWDAQNKLVKKTYTGLSTVSRLNNLIQKKKSDAMDIILKLHENDQLNSLSVAKLKERITKQNSSQSFLDYCERLESELTSANRIGTARSYRGVRSVLKTFNNDRDISFREVNYTFLAKFETYHKSRGNEANGLAVYMRTIRAIYNKAIKEGLADKDQYPFNDYKIKTTPTEKRALDFDLLKKIIEIKLTPDHVLFHTRNFFLASYMMYGMNFTDMAFLTKSNLNNGRINYRRKKTSKLYNVKVTENLFTILNHYLDLDTEYIFPIIKRETAALQAKDIQWARKRYNKKLKELAESCEIEQNLTSYVSRHSFATQAMLQQVPLNAISTMLGHSSLKTTEVYLKSLPSNILDDYNSKVLDNLL